MSLAPNLTPLAALVGTWRGAGAGSYPTISDFEYLEEVEFVDIGKPFLTYVQRTRSADGAPMHTESGFLRLPEPGVAEFVLAQPTGQTELCEGGLDGGGEELRLELTGRIVNSATAKRVDETRRTYELRGDTLTMDFGMAAVGQPMTHHLHSELRRVVGS